MYLCCMCKLILNLNPEYLELQPLYFIYLFFLQMKMNNQNNC